MVDNFVCLWHNPLPMPHKSPEERRVYWRQWRLKNRTKQNAWARKYYRRNRKKVRKYQNEYRNEHPHLKAKWDPVKGRARCLLNHAIRDGKIIRPTACQQCGKARKIQAHHHNGYDEAHYFDVLWLCIPCHAAEHREK